MIVSDTMCTAAGVYTKNKVKGAPIVVTKNHLVDGHAQAVICNSGNANTCAPNGLEIAEETCALTAKALGLLPTDIIVASTGVIGKEMEIGPFATGIPQLVDAITYEGSQAAAHAIMTTDTKLKEVAVEFTVGGKTCHNGRNCQRQRHDSPQYGHHALLYHHRCGHFGPYAAKGPVRRCARQLQPGQRGPGYLHQ